MNSDAFLSSSRRRALTLAQDRARRHEQDRLSTYRPYGKQREFHEAGAAHRERLFMAGNQLGKTLAGSFEWAMHLTGRYPDWWRGRRFDAPGRYWAAGETRISTRDTVQKLLLGDPERPEAWGKGAIPGDTILTTHRAAGAANAIDAVTIAHVAGGASTLLFKAYGSARLPRCSAQLTFPLLHQDRIRHDPSCHPHDDRRRRALQPGRTRGDRGVLSGA